MSMRSKLGELRQFVRTVGAVNALKTFVRLRDFGAYGSLKGCDQFGNCYFEKQNTHALRTRFVVFGDAKNYDGSDVPPEWYGWLHHLEDSTPAERPVEPAPAWVRPHERNQLSNFGLRGYMPRGYPLRSPTLLGRANHPAVYSCWVDEQRRKLPPVAREESPPCTHSEHQHGSLCDDHHDPRHRWGDWPSEPR